MLTPTSISSLEPPVKTCEIENLSELIKHIQSCELQQFTGRLDLDIKEASNSLWSLFFYAGKLVGAASEMHSVRCWYRQMAQACPQFKQATYERKLDQPQWSYFSIQNLLKQGKIPQKQLESAIEGCVTEILFDIFQQDQQQVERLPIQLSYRRVPPKFQDLLQIPISTQQVWLKASHDWKLWQQAGFDQYSPNLAPVIWSKEELRKHTSPAAYQNVTALVDGDRTLRDLAIRLKQPLVSLTRSIMPYVNRGIMGLIEVEDFNTSALPNSSAAPSTSTANQQEPAKPLVVYIDDSRFDRITMGQILLKAGYRFINIQDPLQALPTLIEQKPDLIFLDLLMPVTNGYEVCAQIRRVSALKNTPIIMVTSRDGIVDRVRAKLVDATGFIAKPIESEKVLTTLLEHLPTVQADHPSPQPQTLNRNLIDWQKKLGSPVKQL
ncbi:response regulator [Oculatella sp. FACHB-28]|uniref:response regulator n=1 Tax=Oculatella sp. FACHB-28 TaxID=2692845 RepID=UPI00168692BC|nr:response regulator [Oculatella sp. FACHB-28]MBD2058517.1 response regulator [Oculatella sp. FACHB-28]